MLKSVYVKWCDEFAITIANYSMQRILENNHATISGILHLRFAIEESRRFCFVNSK